jgi:hypothetical protein
VGPVQKGCIDLIADLVPLARGLLRTSTRPTLNLLLLLLLRASV